MADVYINIPGNLSSSIPLKTISANVTTSSVLILDSNPARRGFTLYNNSSNSCYVTFGPTSSSASPTAIVASFVSYTPTLPVNYTGQISAIRNAGTGTIIITELL